MVEGEIQFSKLYILSPDSDVFPIKPTPENPCWVVTSINEGHMEMIIIDAVTGGKLGNGIPPPSNAFALSGPVSKQPCSGDWSDWSENAEYWFNEMGYNTETAIWPTEDEVKNHIQSNDTMLFYETAHGSYYAFARKWRHINPH